MRKIAFAFAVFFFACSAFVNAQCTGGRYHDLVFPGSPTVTSDIVYGSNLDQFGATVSLKLDIYEPACDNATNRPLIVFAHGGGFVSGDKTDAGYVQTAVALAQLGYVVANINYRLGFPTNVPDGLYGFNSAIMRGLHDARAAVRFCRDNALNGGNTWKIDPNNIFFGGVSAGGIIALHLAYQNQSNEMTLDCGGQPGTNQTSVEGLSNTLNVSSSVKAIISISGGIRDLNWIKTNDIPVFMAHGTIDGTVPYGSSYFVPQFQLFPIHGSSSIAPKCASTSTPYCFKPMYGQDHVPSNVAYVDTVATLMRNFLEHFTCGITLNCSYNGSPALTTSSVSIAITAGSNPTCTGSSVTFTATPTNGGATPSYQWKKNGSNVGTNSSTFTSTTLVNNDAITCVMTPTSGCGSSATSNSITMSVSAGGAAAVSIALTSGTNPTCSGQSLTFTATPTNGGSAPTYQWKKNGGNVGTNSSIFTSTALANNDAITCALTSNSSCASPTTATSNSITVTVSSATIPTVAIALTAGSNPTCSGESLTFTATPTNGGSAPSYQWKKNGSNAGTNSSTFTSTTLANNDAITCVLTSNASCASPTTATSNSITVSVTASAAPAVAIAITSGSNPSCSGESLTFTATPTNGGSSPSYQWKKNSSNVGTNSSTFTSTTLANNDVITCDLTSNSSCANPTSASSNSITVSVSSAVTPTVSIAITAGSNPSCAGESVTFTATPTGGGSAPAYQWKTNGAGAGSSSVFTSAAFEDNDVITCVLTSNLSCASSTTATSNSETMTVFTAPTISQNGNVLTATTSSSYQWYLAGQAISGATSQNYTATANGSYSVKGDGDCSSQTLAVTVTSIIEQAEENFFTVFPNPSTGAFNISFNALANESYLVELKNTAGATVYKETIPGLTGKAARRIDVSHFGKGIYLLVLTGSEQVAFEKLVIY